MRRIIFILLILFLCIPIVVYAHSGKTDSRGGHTNRSTGEYHYHHGYSAHDHYDMDGDGDVDCPYDFKDRTSGNQKGNYSYSKNEYQPNKFSGFWRDFKPIFWRIFFCVLGWVLFVIFSTKMM